MDTAAEEELKTFWCHDCDMSVALTFSSSSSPLLCPYCNTNFLELIDSPFHQNDAVSPLSIFSSPFLHSLIFTNNPNVTVFENDDFGEDLLALVTSQPRATDTVTVIAVTDSLLLNLDPNGVVLCAVCKDEIAVNDKAKILPCNHLYHCDCITPWLLNHDSCPICRFRIVEGGNHGDGGGGGGGGGGGVRSRDMRRHLREAMTRLSELMEEEEEDFYGLRTSLNHIAYRHGILHEDSDGSGVSESMIAYGGSGDEQLP